MLGNLIAKYDKCMTDENGALIVSFNVGTADKQSAKQTITAIKTALSSGKNLFQIDIDVYREKRSHAANNYFWQLCSQLAVVLNSSKIEVYRKYIKEQCIFRKYEISEKAVDSFMYLWGRQGDGWIIEKLDYAQTKGFVLLHAYYGSSVFNKKQMTRLIESIVDDCKDLGIQTKTPQEIAEMVSIWQSAEKACKRRDKE